MRSVRISLYFSLILLGVLGLISGCQPSPSVSPLESPMRAEQLESPGETLEALEVPTPVSGTGVVWGRVVEQTSGLAPLESTIFLGGLTYMDTGIPIVALHQDEAPYAIPSTDGWFVISDVPPGEYGVIMLTPDVSFLMDDNDGGSLLIEVEADEILDLGEITVIVP
jgi:hypothetical protein